MYSVNTENCPVILVSGSLTCRLDFIKPMNPIKHNILCLCACVIFGEGNVHSPYQISKSPSLLPFILLFKGKQAYCLLSSSPHIHLPVPFKLIFSRQIYFPWDTPLWTFQLSHTTWLVYIPFPILTYIALRVNLSINISLDRKFQKLLGHFRALWDCSWLLH